MVTTKQLIEASEKVAAASQELKAIKERMSEVRRKECTAENELNEAVKAFEALNRQFLDESDPNRRRKTFALPSA